MATTVPETIRSSATAGERLLFSTLKDYLPDDFIVYYEPEIQGKRPDFVIIGPDLGLVVLEVKDYLKNSILTVNNDEWTIFSTAQEQATVKSPLLQARQYMFHIMNRLQKDSNLINLEGKYRSQLKFPCGHGVVFTRMQQKDFVENQLYNVMEPNMMFARDEIDPEREAFSEANLMEKLLNMFTVPYRLREPLSYDDINAIRYHLFPEVRISAEFKPIAPHQDRILLSLHDIKTMDLHQENLAKQLGDKNRLIRGVAGSGKTLILASRAKMLSRQHPDWKILILCYNVSLAQNIRQMMEHMFEEQADLFDFVDENKEKNNVEVFNFHAWLYNKLRIKPQDIPSIVEKLKNKEAILPQYDAILIDEGQDFEAEWFTLVSNLLNPETKSLLLVEDRAQEIYKRKRSYVQDTGLDFRGRSKVLSINYRNTAQIVKFAWDFYQKNSALKNKVVEKDFQGEIIAPKSTRRKGPDPAIIQASSFKHEIRQVSKIIHRLHKEKQVPYDEMLILYRVKNSKSTNYIQTIQNKLADEGIPYYWLTQNRDSKNNFQKNDGKLKISTIESSKGLDFQAVFIVNVDNMPFALEDDVEREVSLLYIAMTRAQNYLSISYSGESEFTQYFEKVKEERLLGEEPKQSRFSK
ncbi:AAA family ATPase [Aquibacillus koreensis]|uniref:AAA family ATPase n=1 Tax=Aquibacillus koreensis TaxID=279446 RepID=A0A9X3WH24_9BACI|nr:nuclease-related domain-containing DEAD/DEAH box helicase [Aquibacillus koreensis]MCT2534762.1 AAA family ATPase [Aquibacillus koreensis]MDC3419627.1 AAA family ATPase [Aquibacillus koreensis]